MNSTPTRPVHNVVIATKGLRDRNIYTQAGTTVENKGKLMYVIDVKVIVYVCVCQRVCVCVCVCKIVSVLMYVCMYKCMCTYVFTCFCVYICECKCVYV